MGKDGHRQLVLRVVGIVAVFAVLFLLYLWANMGRLDPRASMEFPRMNVAEYAESHWIPFPAGFEILPQPNVPVVRAVYPLGNEESLFDTGQQFVTLSQPVRPSPRGHFSIRGLGTLVVADPARNRLLYSLAGMVEVDLTEYSTNIVAVGPSGIHSEMFVDLGEGSRITTIGAGSDEVYVAGSERPPLGGAMMYTPEGGRRVPGRTGHRIRVFDAKSGLEIRKVEFHGPETLVWPTEIRFGQFDGDHRRFLFATREYKAGETLMDQLWAWSVEDGSVELLHDWRGGVQPYPWEFMTLSHAGTRLTFMGREEGNQVLAELGLDPPGPPRVLFEIPSELWRIHRLVRRDGDRLIVQCQVKAHRESGPVTASDGTLLANLFEGLVEIDLATVAASREVVER